MKKAEYRTRRNRRYKRWNSAQPADPFTPTKRQESISAYILAYGMLTATAALLAIFAYIFFTR